MTTPRVVHKSGSIDKKVILSSDLVKILWIDIDENLLSSLRKISVMQELQVTSTCTYCWGDDPR